MPIACYLAEYTQYNATSTLVNARDFDLLQKKYTFNTENGCQVNPTSL